MQRLVFVVVVLVLVVSASAVNITRWPPTGQGQKRQLPPPVTMMDAAANNLSWVVQLPCALSDAELQAVQQTLVASAAVFEATSGTAGVPCILTFAAQSVSQTLLVATCAATDDTLAPRILAAANAAAGTNADLVACIGGATLTRDQVMNKTSSTTQMISDAGLWNLDRVDQRNLPLSGTYTYALDGTNVTIYLIDTGCRVTHNEYTGRASLILDVVGDGVNNDCNGTL